MAELTFVVMLDRLGKRFACCQYHTRAVLSPEAVTTRCPSGLNCAELTSPSCFIGSVSAFLLPRPIPAPSDHRGRQHPLPIGAELRGIDHA